MKSKGTFKPSKYADVSICLICFPFNIPHYKIKYTLDSKSAVVILIIYISMV